MPTIRDVLAALESIAPRRFAFSYDKVGLQVGNPDQAVTKAVVSLDRSLGATRFAGEIGAELLLAHHPLIFTPMDTVDTRSHQGRTVVELIRQGTGFIAAHTNWDSAMGGINDTLAGILGLTEVAAFGSAADVKSLKLVFTCPTDVADPIIEAASAAGAGVIGAYSHCAFTSHGIGQFIGGEDSNPSVGQRGALEQVHEARVEMWLPGDRAAAVERAIRKVHPYEEPAIDFYMLRAVAEQPAGRVGKLPSPVPLAGLANLVDQTLMTRSWTWGDPQKSVKKVAVVGGAADSEWMEAQRAGADVLITGEVKQHVAVEASESGMTLIAAGHYQTEHPGSAELRNRMAAAMPEIEWHLFTPEPGLAGRPF